MPIKAASKFRFQGDFSFGCRGRPVPVFGAKEVAALFTQIADGMGKAASERSQGAAFESTVKRQAQASERSVV